MSSYAEVSGDVIETARKVAARTKQLVVIPHVCNNRATMGAGVALALAIEWPSILPEYQELCMQPKPLGRQTRVEVQKDIIVCNMIAQDGFAGEPGVVPLQYAALGMCMGELRDYLTEHPGSIVAPRFGAGLAGGNWGVIKKFIHEVWTAADINVTIAVS